jgi:LPXTG-motif cell wall-anchored protein
LNIKPAYLKEITGPYSLKLTYYAKVTDNAVTNVSATDNKVTVEYSNDPSDETSKGTKHDVTNHYKFALDAELFGDSQYHTSELVKVGLDGSGQPIYERTGYSNYSTHSALAGAKFGLYSTKDAAVAAIGTDGNGLVSGEDGRFLIGNLDVGTYYLVETKAPDGYIRDNAIYQIVITATEKNVTVDDGDCTYTTDVLDKYTVSVSAIEGETTTAIASSTYTMSYGATDGETIHTHETITLKSSSKVTEENKENHLEDNTAEIRNRKGTELPSTGGIGTTIFYILGGVLVVGAAIILVARRKADEK